MLRLQCVSQGYDWGKLGSSSAVAQLQQVGEGVAIQEGAPYAEYWFGTHPSGPSRVAAAAPGAASAAPLPLLQDWLLAHPAALGAPPYNATSALPFLLKVLSVAKALSVQAHPDRQLAVKLHAARPDMYRDDNHKPEMAVALTPFDAMCGFRCGLRGAARAWGWCESMRRRWGMEQTARARVCAQPVSLALTPAGLPLRSQHIYPACQSCVR